METKKYELTVYKIRDAAIFISYQLDERVSVIPDSFVDHADVLLLLSLHPR